MHSQFNYDGLFDQNTFRLRVKLLKNDLSAVRKGDFTGPTVRIQHCAADVSH